MLMRFHLANILGPKGGIIRSIFGISANIFTPFSQNNCDGGMWMKKYVFLYTFTAVAILAIAFAGQSAKNSIPHISVIKLEPASAEDTVNCTGKVEALGGTSVFATQPGFVRKLYVEVGDNVTVGQPLMDIAPSQHDSSTNAANSQALPGEPEIPSEYNSVYQTYAGYLSKLQGANSAGGSSSSFQADDDVKTAASSDEKPYTLKATSAGVIESIGVSSEGEYLGTISAAAVIRSKGGIQVRLSVDESQIADLKEGQRVQISGAGFKNSTYTGSVKSISGTAKQLVSATGQETVVEVIASVKDPGTDIKPGFTAKAKITTSQNSHLLVVPYEAVREDGKENEFVYCIDGSKVKKVNIKTGREFDSGFEVKSGLHAGDVIVTEPDSVAEDMNVITDYTTAGSKNG